MAKDFARTCRLELREETCAQVVILSKHARLTKPKATAQTHVSGAFIAKYEIWGQDVMAHLNAALFASNIVEAKSVIKL